MTRLACVSKIDGTESSTHTAFGPDGRTANEQLQPRFEANIMDFMDSVEASKHYPYVKHAWIEFLGESPDPMLDRVQSR
jgi:hypothetical protein